MKMNPSSPGIAELLPAKLRTAKAAGAAVLGSLLAYLVVVEVIRAAIQPFFGLARLGGGRTAVRYATYLAAAAAILAVRWVNGLAAKRSEAETEGAHLGRLLAISVAGLALAEVPAVLGLALFLLGGYNSDFYVLLFVSAMLTFMYFPRASVWQARLASSRRTCPF